MQISLDDLWSHTRVVWEAQQNQMVWEPAIAKLGLGLGLVGLWAWTF